MKIDREVNGSQDLMSISLTLIPFFVDQFMRLSMFRRYGWGDCARGDVELIRITNEKGHSCCVGFQTNVISMANAMESFWRYPNLNDENTGQVESAFPTHVLTGVTY